VADVVQPRGSDEEIPVSFGRSGSGSLSPSGHSLRVQPPVPELRKKGLGEVGRSSRRAQCRRDGWNGGRVEQ
ncbi:hypothetical protein, partial [Streptomyces sp. NPDC002952]|uniref:hypothetical protein n=1 Tax=Streptomyces sp. NPDC002952 TaxID=3364673 RepID=UPI003699F225